MCKPASRLLCKVLQDAAFTKEFTEEFIAESTQRKRRLRCRRN